MWLLITYAMVTKYVLKEFKRAGKIVSGAIRGTAYATILSEISWESSQARRERRKLILFADILHGNAPNYLQRNLPHPSSLEPLSIAK